MTTHLSDEQLVLFYYGEAEESVGIEAHLAGCEACRAEFQTIQRVLNTTDALPIPDRGPDYNSEVWRRLEARIRGRSRSWWPSFGMRLALTGSMAALLVMAFLVGRVTRPPEAPATVQVEVRERVLLLAVSDHLERSQVVLAELVNTRPKHSVDIDVQKEWAEEMVSDNRLFRQTAAEVGEPDVAEVLEDLERVLLEIAHSPSRMAPAQLQSIRARIEEQGILFKVRVLGEQVRQRDNAPAKTPGRKS